MLISAIIPTYKRPESLLRALKSLEGQKLKPDEIIVVSGEPDSPSEKLRANFPLLNLKLIHTEPSVCLQRNRGIDAAQGRYILLCDDDVELPLSYLHVLTDYLERNPGKNIATGLFTEIHNGQWEYEFIPKSSSSLIYKFIFCHSIWGSLNKIKPNSLTRPILNYYRRIGNTRSRAGWPVITKFSGPVIETLYYSLGASVIRHTYFNEHKFDEVLDRSGIGDNYGMTINEKDIKQINILTEVQARHHKVYENRLAQRISYFRRIMAMDYFIRISGKKTFTNYLALIWSVCGNFLSQTVKGKFKMSWACLRALVWLLLNRNPYVIYKNHGIKFCSP